MLVGMDPHAVRTDIRVDLVAFSEPLASKRFHALDEAAAWACGTAGKLRMAFEPDMYRQLDQAMRVSIEMTVVAEGYSHHCKVWSGAPSAAETSAIPAAKKFAETALPGEIAAAKNAGTKAEKSRTRRNIGLALAGAAVCALIYGALRALPPVFDLEVQSARVLSAPPDPLAGGWAGSLESCEQGRVVFARGKVEIVAGALASSFPASYERTEGQAIKVIVSMGGARLVQTVRIDSSGSALQIQRVEVSDGIPRNMAAMAAGTRLVRCR
ncbi:MAG: hypothetical protein ACK5XA_11660 [Tagaea sp.]